MNTSDCEHWTESEIEYWNLKKEKLRIKYSFIPDEEFKYTGDMEKEMLRLLCYRLHLTKENMIDILSKL